MKPNAMSWLEKATPPLVYFPTVGKVSIVKGWQKLTKPTTVDIDLSDQNIGLMTGKTNSISVIDIDVKDRGLEIWSKLIKQYDTTNIIALHGEFQVNPIHQAANSDADPSNDAKIVFSAE